METDGTCVQWSNSCFAEGEHCKAYKGRYIGGPKNGKPCVVKRLKRQSESKPPNQFLRDIEIAEIAQNLAKEFNALPEVLISEPSSPPNLANERASKRWSTRHVRVTQWRSPCSNRYAPHPNTPCPPPPIPPPPGEERQNGRVHCPYPIAGGVFIQVW